MSTQVNGPAVEPQAIPESTKAITKFTAEHAHEVGLPSPQAVNYMMSVATLLANSALVTPDMGLSDTQLGRLKGLGFTPQQIDEHQEKIVKANAMAKMLVGREMGIEPMAAMQEIDIVKSRIFVRYPQLINQMLMKNFKLKWLERTHERAALEVTRPGMEPETFEFTIEDARRAGLAGREKDGQYEKRPRVMLTARVVSEAYRTTGGYSKTYTPEEKEEILGGEAEADVPEIKRSVNGGSMGDFKVGLKNPPKEEPAPATAPVVETTAEPVSEPQPERKAAEKPTEKPKPQYWIRLAFKDATGEFRLLATNELPQDDIEAATLRAHALAAEHAQPYVVVEVVNGEVVAEKCICNPPAHSSHINRVAPKDEPEPAAAAKPATSVPQPETAKDPEPPKAEAKAAKAQSPERKAMLERLEALAKKLGIPSKTAGSRFNAFFAEYLGVSVKELPKDVTAYGGAIQELESLITRDPLEFSSGPAQAGKRCRALLEDLHEYATTAWPRHTALQDLACRLARQWGLDKSGFEVFITRNGIDFMPEAEAYALLRVYFRTREAARLKQVAVDHNLSVEKIVSQIETRAPGCRPIEDAPVATLEAAILGFVQAVKEEVKPPAQPGPQLVKPATQPEPQPDPEPEPAEEEDGGGLFSDLE